jgi:site-specific recombinase XerD
MKNTLQGYQTYLQRLPLSRHTKRNYYQRVRHYLTWLSGSPEGDRALQDGQERDFAIMDYKTRLLQTGHSASTVNAILGTLDNFYCFLGLGNAKVRRQDLPQQAPKALKPEELKRVLRSVGRCSSQRNKTIALLFLHTGLRISELAALNVGDVFVTARKGEITVRCGKNSKQRKIPLNADIREVMQAYLSGPRNPDEPLFKSQRGSRISTGAIDHLIRQIADDAGVEMSCHTLRHSCLTRLLHSGADIVTVAEVAGHSRLETTRRYTLPSQDVKIEAMEKLNYAT